MSARQARAYAALLRLLPAAFRERFGGDMEDVFAHRLAQARSAPARTWVWTRGLLDVAALAVGEWPRTLMTNRGGGGMGTLVQDVRYAVRTLSRAPGLTAVVLVTLALGIGASTATFSVVHGVLLKPLPYAEAERLVAPWPEENFNASMLREMVAASPALEDATGYSGWSFTLTGQGEPLDVDGARVSPQHFRVLGVRPFLGRDFTAEEGVPGADGVVILSHGLWMRAFGGDPAILGRTIELATNDMPRRTVIGVMPPDYRPISGRPDAWVPLSLEPGTEMAADNTWYVNERVARLARGATLAQATEQVRAFARQVREAMPRLIDEEDVQAASVRPLQAHAAGSVGPVLWVALGAVSLVLLIACANVANLLLARGEARGRDLAVRAALGAGRDRVVRLLLVESGVLGLVGGAVGVALSFGLVRLVVALAPADFPRVRDISVDSAVLLYALAGTSAATLLAGLVPAVRVSRVDAASSLGGATRASSGRRRSRLTPALVGVEVALAVMVVVGSGLMLRSLHRMSTEDPGLSGEGVLVFRPNPPSGRYPDGEAFQAYYAEVLARVAALPQVERASAIHLLPATPNNWSFPTYPEGVEIEGTVPSVNIRLVHPGYFETVGIPVAQGRALLPSDDAGAEKVVVVNQAFVDRFWPGADPLARSLRIMGANNDPHRVVGVVGDVRQHGLGREPRPEMYFAHRQLAWNASFWIMARMRPGVDPLEQAASVQEAAWSVDPDVPVSGMDELSRVFGASAATTRFLAGVLGVFGALALLLGAVGVFGVTTFTVGRRTPEFGVRIALGASRGEVLGSALGGSLVPVAVGLAVGLAGAAASAGALASVLYEVEPSDPATYAGVALTLLLVATLASLLPAWRASRLDPVSVLNGE
ncbi:MAG: hypothetical protein AMXMBFR53_22310 [Gemmatimonadota bacterium]